MHDAKHFLGCALAALCLTSAAGAAPPAPATDSVHLDRYALAAGPLTIDGVTENASGLAYCPESKSVFLVVNRPTFLVELDLDGKPKRTIPLNGFDDTEDVAYVGPGTLAIVEEGRRNLVLVHVPAGAGGIDYAGCAKYRVEDAPSDNTGLEGVVYDAAHKRYYVVKEKLPRRLYQVVLPAAAHGRPTVTMPWDIEKHSLGMTDLSGIGFDRATGHLLVLSDESKCVVECTLAGEEVSRLLLQAGHAGMQESAPQPEGIALADDGTLYICSEPNRLYIFKPAKP